MSTKCDGCGHKENNPDGGWCYMFEHKQSPCGRYEAIEPRPSGSTGFIGCVHKGWAIECMPKPGKPGVVDWDATHPEAEIMLNGKSIEDLMDQIDAL